MECDKGKMSSSPPKVIVPSPTNSLGAGDSLFQAIVGLQTHQLSFSTSPVQIIRQRYWCKPPHRKPLNFFQRIDAEKDQKLKKVKNTIHASLEDLRNNSDCTLADGRRKSTPNILNEMESYRSGNNSRREKSQAARRVYEVLMLNAWRKRKEDSAGLVIMIQSLSSELDKQRMYCHLVKSLLKKETQRSECAMKEISILNSKIQEQIKMKEALGEEKEESERIIMELEDKLSHEMTLRSNAVNDLIEAKNEQIALETQLRKEREKLIKLRDEIATAAGKVSTLEEILADKNNWIDRMKKINENQRERLESLERSMAAVVEAERTRYEELLEEKTSLTRTVSLLEEEKNGFESEILSRIEEAKVQGSRLVALEKELSGKEIKHEIEMKNALELLSEILNERRTLESMNVTEEQDRQLTAKKFLCEIIRLPITLLNGIFYAIWPLEVNNRRHSI